jgi:hypothetical protein
MFWSFLANFYAALKYLLPPVLFLIGWRTSNWLTSCYLLVQSALKGLSYEIDFENVDKF